MVSFYEEMLGLLPIVNNVEAAQHIQQGSKYISVPIKYKIIKEA